MLTSSYKNNLTEIKNALRSDKSFDLVERDLFIGGRNAAMFFVDGFLKNDIAENIIYGWQDELGEISSKNPQISDFPQTVEEQTAKEFEASLSPTGEEAPF